MRTSTLAAVTALAALAFAAHAGAATAGQPPPLWTHGMFSAHAQQVQLVIRPAPAEQLLKLDWRTGIAPAAADERVQNANFAVRPGDAVTVTVVNYTTEEHTFTSPKLGVSAVIKAGSAKHPSRTVLSFTAWRFGSYRWFCALPCGGYMGGTVYAIVKL